MPSRADRISLLFEQRGMGRSRRISSSPSRRRCAAAVAHRRLRRRLLVLGGRTSKLRPASGYPGVDNANTRYVGGPIDRATAPTLKPAWKLPLSGQSTYGSLRLDPDRRRRRRLLAGPRLERAGDRPRQRRSALDEEIRTGRPGPERPRGRRRHGLRRHRRRGLRPRPGNRRRGLDDEAGGDTTEGIDMAPGYHDGLVYVSTVPTNATPNTRPAGSGRSRRSTPRPARRSGTSTPSRSLWGKPGDQLRRRPLVPAVLRRQGRRCTSAPATRCRSRAPPSTRGGRAGRGRTSTPTRWSSSTPRPASCEWFYQQTPHDIYDWDFQDPPILTSAGGTELAIGAGKSGVVVALDAKTGKPVWKPPVGTHNGHDDDGLLAMRGEFSKLKTGATSPRATIGGVIAPMAASKTTVFVPVVNHAVEF